MKIKTVVVITVLIVIIIFSLCIYNSNSKKEFIGLKPLDPGYQGMYKMPGLTKDTIRIVETPNRDVVEESEISSDDIVVMDEEEINNENINRKNTSNVQKRINNQNISNVSKKEEDIRINKIKELSVPEYSDDSEESQNDIITFNKTKNLFCDRNKFLGRDGIVKNLIPSRMYKESSQFDSETSGRKRKN